MGDVLVCNNKLIIMNQRFLTNCSLIEIKYIQGDRLFCMGNESFLRSEIFLSTNEEESNFQNYLFYAQTETNNNLQFKTLIQFQQEVLFRHKLSNKYLSYTVEYKDDQNDSVIQLELSDKPSFWKIMPCFQYQTKISPKVKFNQDVYLAIELNSSKMGFINVRQGEENGRLHTSISLNLKTKFTFHSYFELDREQKGYMYSQAVWIKHVQTNTFTTVVKPQTSQQILFESMDLQDNVQSINGLWLIESVKMENGGNLNYNQPFYLKSLCTQKYLSFQKDSKNNSNQKNYNICLVDRPLNQSKFYFQSLKGEESKIKKGAYLKFKHLLSGFFVGMRLTQKADSMIHFPVLTFSEFQDEDLFDLMQLKVEEEEPIRFIFSINRELSNMNKLFADKKFTIGRRVINQIQRLYINIIGELDKLANDYMFEQIQEELGSSIPFFCQQITELRQRIGDNVQNNKGLLKLMKYVYEVLKRVCKNYKDNQVIAYRYMKCYISDVFIDVGAEQLLSEVLRNNYSLLCKTANDLPQLNNRNIINVIFSKIISAGQQKNGLYWSRMIKVFDLLQVLLVNRFATIDINQRIIATELFEKDVFSKILFEIKVFNQRIRILHPELKKWVQIQQLNDNKYITTLQRMFDLLSKLCQNRNYISKQYIDRYLNAVNQDAVQIIISYLNIPISLNLSNSLFSLITNCYIDSSPRIDRNKPLPIINFSLNQTIHSSQSSDNPNGNLLKQNLLDKSQQIDKYLNRTWNISNILQGMTTNEPALNETEFDLYKQELNEKMRENDWSQQLLRSIWILIKLESYRSSEIENIQKMLSNSILQGCVKKQIIATTMQILQEINSYGLQLELKKVTAYLKYKFSKQNQRGFSTNDIKYYLTAAAPITARKINGLKEGVQMIVDSSTSIACRKEYNNLLEAINLLSPKTDLRKYLLDMFVGNEGYSFSMLRAIFKTILNFYSPKMRIVNLLSKCIILTNEQVQDFNRIFILYKKLKHLTSIAQHWLSNSKGQSQQSKDYCYILLQFTNYLFDQYVLDSSPDGKFRKTSKININRQLLVLNLSVHTVVLGLLNTNYYLLQFKDKKQISQKVRNVFEITFEFLYYFSLNCQQSLQAVIERLQVVNQYGELLEVGQTKLLISLYKQSSNLVKQVKSTTVQKVIVKIIKVPLNSTLERECEYNPEYVQFLNILCFQKEKIYKKNLQIIFKVIQKEIILRKILFTKKNKLNLDGNSEISQTLQIPILYHKYIVKLFCLLLQYLESSGTSIKNKIKDIINIDELIKILTLPDIYSQRGIIAEMNFLLKKQVIVLFNLYLDKTDSLVQMYESQALFNLLQFYVNVFLLNKEKEVVQCHHQEYYRPFMEQYAQEIKCDMKNLRDFFLNSIQPLLKRLFSLFEKYSLKESNKNYQKLILLLQNIVIAELPQNHLLRNEVNGIDLIQIKWRNFVDMDLQNSVEEKYVKQTLLELLRSQQTYKMVQQQKEKFFKAIKLNEEKYFSMMSKLIEMASQQENQTENSEQSRIFFYQMIKNLAEYLMWTDIKDDKRKEEKKKKSFEGEQLAETLIGYVIREQFQYNNTISRKTFYQILRILVFLLEHDEDAQLLKYLYKIFTESLSCFRFFNCLKDALAEISNRVTSDKSHEQINEVLGTLYVCGQQRKCQIDKYSLKFLSLLCKHIPFTDLLRNQPYNISTDFLDKIYNSFYFLVKRTQKMGISINVSIVTISEQILDCVLAMLNGCNQTNQNYIVDNKFPQIVVEALKMDVIQDNKNGGDLAKRDRLMQQVCGFYQANGINVEGILNQKIRVMDFSHRYLLNRFKYMLLKLVIQIVLANQRGLSKIKILIPLELLKINLIWIYEDFKKENIEYSQQNVLRKKQQWLDVISRGDKLNSIFLMIGFYFYQLIQYNNLSQKESVEEEAETAMSEEKEKQKIVKKFFSSIADKQQNEQKVKALEKEPFAEQMKMFYFKYYQAYQFFKKNTVTIEANIFDHMVKVYFPKIPLCDKITEKMEQKLVHQAQRISHEQKVKSLMSFQKQTYDFLQGEEDYFIEMDKKSSILGKIVRLVKNQQSMYFFVWCVSVIIVLGYLIDDFSTPTNDFNEQFASYLKPSSFVGFFVLICSLINLLCGILLLVNVVLRKIPFLLRLYQYKYEQQLEQQGQMQQSLAVYRAKHILSAAFFDFYCIGFSILTIFHPLFAGFLLIYIIKLIELGKTIVRAIEQTWFNLVVTAGLLIVFNYVFSILIYSASFTDDVGYGNTCTNLFRCLLMLVDQSLKAGSGFLATNTTDYVNMTLNFKVIAEIMYILFAQKVIFQIFSGTIIDKFGELREEGDSTEKDQKSNCFICGLQRFQIDFDLQGFEKHIEQSHNKMNYIYYLFYLRRKGKREYGIEENYVWNTHEKAINDWIPDGTSIQKQIKEKEEHEEKDEDDIEEYQKYYHKKLQEFKKLHQRVQNMSSSLKEENTSL